MKRLLEKLLNLTEKDIFKPYSFEEFIQKNCTLNSDGTYSSESDIDLSGLDLIKLPVKFKEVKGDFDCTNNKLTSLEGAPEKVGESFWCEFNNLTTLEGAPKHVGWDFNCRYNQLTSLKGAPEKVGERFVCTNNPVPAYELRKTVKRDYL